MCYALTTVMTSLNKSRGVFILKYSGINIATDSLDNFILVFLSSKVDILHNKN
jgi:hypothetical protein